MHGAARAPGPAGQSPSPHAPPGAAELALRARWLAGMDACERDALGDMAIREVEARFSAWAAGLDDGARPGDHVRP